MLLNTFSPKMVKADCVFTGKEVSLKTVKKAVTRPWPWLKNNSGFPMWLCHKSAVSHENTAKVLSTLLNAKVDFERQNVELGHGSTAWVIVPNFRATESREYTLKEVTKAGFSCFKVIVYDPALPQYEVLGQSNDVGGSLCTGGKFDSLEEASTSAKTFQEEGFYPCWVTDSHEL